MAEVSVSPEALKAWESLPADVRATVKFTVAQAVGDTVSAARIESIVLPAGGSHVVMDVRTTLVSTNVEVEIVGR